MAAIEIRKNPQNMSKILDKYFTPEEPEMSEDELALAGQGGLPQQIPAQEPDIATVLAGLAGAPGGPGPGGPIA